MAAPFRADQVGSLLRPERLKQAREKYLGPQTPTSALGPHKNPQLREVEDQCIREVIAMQEAIGLQALTDGEFRRRSWWLELILGWQGFAADRTGSAKLKWRDASGPTQGFSDLNVVGPIRSARPVDADLLRQLGGGYFAYSGAAPDEIAPAKDHSNAVLICQDCGAGGFYRSSSRRAPFNVYASTADLYADGVAQRKTAGPPPPLFAFGAASPTATPAGTVTMSLSGVSGAGWQWDGHHYVRSQNGRPDVLVDGAPVVADDVVVLQVAIRGTGIIDQAHNEDPLVVVIGSGTAWVLRDGTITAGHWSRPTVADGTTLTDVSGQPLRLHPGRTWLELLPVPNQPIVR